MTERRRQEEMGSTIDYFSLLGVSKDAGQDEIEARYRELSDHLASPAIPTTLREWASHEAALLDEAYAILSDPELRAQLEQASVHPAPEPAALPLNGTQAAEVAITAPASVPADSPPPPAQAEPPRPVSAFRALFVGVPWHLVGIGVVAGTILLGAVLFGLGGLSGGGGDDATAPDETTGFAPIDTDRVAELMALVQQDPKNAEATYELGEIFFLGGEWQAGIDWFTKLLELDEANVHALTDVGTANFNLGNYEEAKVAWLKAKELDPNDVQVHYNLGFLFANIEPIDYTAALGEWQAVVDLAPGSDLANTAKVHLDSLAAEASGQPSPAPTEAPASP